MSKENKILDLVVKGEWFDKIKSGEKTHEYRLANTYWHTRINNLARPAKVRFRRGYAKNADTMLFDIKSIKIVNGIHTDLHIHDVVFDIKLGELVKPKFSDGQKVFVVFFRGIWLVSDCTILSHRPQGDFFTYTIMLGKYALREHSFPEDRLFQTEQEAAAEAERLNEIRKNRRFKERNFL